MVQRRAFAAKVGRAEGTVRQSRDEQLLLPGGLEHQREEVVGVGVPPSKSWNNAGGCLHRSWDHRGAGFPRAGRTTEEFLPETPLNAEWAEECPGFALPPNLPPVLPVGQITWKPLGT